MAHDVFISHSNKDKTVADAVCSTLEKRGIRCWIAPRDVPPGQSWPAAIVDAISNSKVFVLIFSDISNQSKQVTTEVGEAFDNGIPIVPLRIDDVKPSQEMGYYIKSIHWLDAMTPPMERHLDKLAESVEALLSVEEKDRLPAAEPVYEAPVKKRWPLPLGVTALIVILAVVIVGAIGIWAISQLGSTTSSTSPAEVASPTSSTRPSEIAPPTEAASTIELVEKPSEVTSTPDTGSDWRQLSFLISNPQLWEQSGDNRYTALGQNEVDAFAWSTETFTGDVTINLDLARPQIQSDGCVIIYGDGQEHSYGSLIFCVDWDGFGLEKHTIYHEGENILAWNFSDNNAVKVHSLTIEIIDDLATMYVNGEKVLSSSFDSKEIDRSGRIGLYKKWFVEEITFSNIQIKSANLGTVIDQSLPATPTPPATEKEKQVVLIAHPLCPQPGLTPSDEIIVRVRWGATSRELAESNADHFTFVFLLDGEEFEDIRPYRQPVESYSGLEEYGCGPSQTGGWVHWDVPVGKLSAGTHIIAVEHILNETVSDGFDTYPGGSLGLLETTFEVQP